MYPGMTSGLAVTGVAIGWHVVAAVTMIAVGFAALRIAKALKNRRQV